MLDCGCFLCCAQRIRAVESTNSISGWLREPPAIEPWEPGCRIVQTSDYLRRHTPSPQRAAFCFRPPAGIFSGDPSGVPRGDPSRDLGDPGGPGDKPRGDRDRDRGVSELAPRSRRRRDASQISRRSLVVHDANQGEEKGRRQAPAQGPAAVSTLQE